MQTNCPHCGATIIVDVREPDIRCYKCGGNINYFEEMRKSRERIKKLSKTPSCPKCKSDKIQASHIKGLFKNTPIYICLSCGYRWKF